MRFLDPQDSEQQGLPPPPTVTSPNQLKASRNTLAWEARLQQPHVQAAQATALSRRGRPGFDGATDLFTSNWEASYYGVFNRLPRQQAAAAGTDAGMPAADAPPADAAAGLQSQQEPPGCGTCPTCRSSCSAACCRMLAATAHQLARTPAWTCKP